MSPGEVDILRERILKALVVVEQRDLWPLDFGDVDVALAADYLAGKSYSNGHYDRIFNLCDYERYQGQGFYVSLLAEAKGRTLAISVGEAPEQVVKTALNAANLIGSGFYGVDLKQIGNECYVIEVNDNPNVDAGNEDGVLGPALYREIMGVMKRRIQDGPHEQLELGARAAS